MKKILSSMTVIAFAWIAGAQNPTVVDLSVVTQMHLTTIDEAAK